MKRSQYGGPINLNGNLFVSFDLKVTGNDPDIHSICDLAMIPMDSSYKVHSELPIFAMGICPENTNFIDEETMTIRKSYLRDILERSMSWDKVLDLFVEYIERFNLKYNKKICVLTYDWPLKKEFLSRFLGKKTFDLFFDYRCRDLLSDALFLNDRACFAGLQIPYPKVDHTYMCCQLKVPHSDSGSALTDARINIDLYRTMINLYV